MSKEIQAVADTITEKPTLVFIGVLPVIIRPLTMAQIYEIGAILEDVEGIDVEGDFNPVVKMLSEYKNIDVCTKVCNIILFKSPVKRWMFGRYVKKHLTMASYRRIIEYAATAFGAAFFLTSFTFLKGAKEVTKKTNTAEAIASGDSLEE